MIILLTGKPSIGKSTAIEKFISLNKLPSSWVVTKAILHPDTGLRIGFEASNSKGEKRTISHKTDIQSDAVIGENRVDIEAVNVMFADALNKAEESEETLTIIDEIGPIQLLSEEFTDSLIHTFNSGANIVASIHYSDKRLSEYRESPLNLLLQVTESNRDILPGALVAITKSLSVINRLSVEQLTIFDNLVIDYIKQAKLLQIQKLTSNAAHYVAEGAVKRMDENHWQVQGNHDTHDVLRRDNRLVCDCDLFTGRGQYTNRAGECSHIQSVMLLFYTGE